MLKFICDVKMKNAIMVILVTISIIIFLCFLTFAPTNNTYNMESTTDDTPVESIREESESTGYLFFDELTDYEDVTKKLANEEVNILVIGKSGCSYCKRYKPLLVDIAENNYIDINYVDVRKLSKNDYVTLLNTFELPAKCSPSNETQKLNQGFNTPLTLFIQNNKSVDCISGYVGKDILLQKINTYN